MTRKLLFGLSALVAAMSLCSSSILPAADDAAPKAKAKAAKDDDSPKGRLPAHYADLVDGEQKDKIYAIQAEYEPQIKQLQTALKEVTAKRDAAIAAVLTPAQQEKLAKVEADMKAKKKAKAMDDKTKDADNTAAAKAN